MWEVSTNYVTIKLDLYFSRSVYFLSLGQVVALIPVETTTANKTDDGEDDQLMSQPEQILKVTKMTQESADKAVLKGVITKSPYIEAYCPKKGCKFFIFVFSFVI